MKKNSEKSLNQGLINRARNKNYLIKSNTSSSLEPIISGNIQTNSQLFKTKDFAAWSEKILAL